MHGYTFMFAIVRDQWELKIVANHQERKYWNFALIRWCTWRMLAGYQCIFRIKSWRTERSSRHFLWLLCLPLKIQMHFVELQTSPIPLCWWGVNYPFKRNRVQHQSLNNVIFTSLNKISPWRTFFHAIGERTCKSGGGPAHYLYHMVWREAVSFYNQARVHSHVRTPAERKQ